MSSPELPAARILLLEDEPAVARVIAMLLRREGCEVVVAETPTAGTRLLDERYDALIVDLRLPEMRGDVFYYLAASRQPWLKDATLFVTGDLQDDALAAISATGRPLLKKPFAVDDLFRAVAAVLPASVARIRRVS